MFKKVKKIIKDSKNLDCIIFSDPVHLSWFAGFSGSTGVLVVTEEGAVLGVDFRYHEIAQDLEKENLDIYCCSERNLLKSTFRHVFGNLERRIGYISSRSTEKQKLLLEKNTKGDLISVDDSIDFARSVKTDKELEGIKESARLNASLFKYVRKLIKPGITERDLASDIVKYAIKNGAEKMAFNPIVASGSFSSRPHASFTNKILEAGEPLTLDIGVSLDGWMSDMTRTWLVPGKKPEKEFLEIFQITNKAKMKAEEKLRESVSGHEVDEEARKVIRDAGYGDFFGHGLGHGVGREVHESPGLFQGSKTQMIKNMVVTIEPGIYLKDKYGVRIEDSYIVGNKKSINLGIDVFSDFF